MPRPRSSPKSSATAAYSAPLSKIIASTRSGEVVAIIGSGVSISLTNNTIPALSWRGLIQNGLDHAVTKGKITGPQAKPWKQLLASPDIDDLLSVAECVTRRLEAPGDLYVRWLENTFKLATHSNRKMAAAIQAIHAAAIPSAPSTTTLSSNKSPASQPSTSPTKKVSEWLRLQTPAVLHLHGSWDSPANCILGIRDYQSTLGNNFRDLIQRNLASFKRLLFIGCGDTFADPNFSALIKWLRENMGAASLEHYALLTEDELPDRHRDPSWEGFVEPLAYGRSHADLPKFLLNHFSALKTAPSRKSAPPKTSSSSSDHAKILENYRAFVLKDCGQMTIEGVGADLDTSERKFDLERLFVPLELLPTPFRPKRLAPNLHRPRPSSRFARSPSATAGL